jgi:DNA-binding transcriptional regulator YiaG
MLAHIFNVNTVYLRCNVNLICCVNLHFIRKLQNLEQMKFSSRYEVSVR